MYSDSEATAAALNTNNSLSSQMDHLTRWLSARHPELQLLAVHIPGRENRSSDALSRGNWRGLLVAEAEAGGARLRRLRPADECDELIDTAISLPQKRIPARGGITHPLSPHALGGEEEERFLRRLHRAATACLRGAFAPRLQGMLASAMKAFARFATPFPQRELFREPRATGDRSAMAHNEWTLMILFATYLSSTTSERTRKVHDQIVRLPHQRLLGARIRLRAGGEAFPLPGISPGRRHPPGAAEAEAGFQT